jgi:hypothetical protein
LEDLDSALEGARARHVDYVIFSDEEVPRARAQIETAVRKGQLCLIYRTPLSGLENDTLYEIVSP